MPNPELLIDGGNQRGDVRPTTLGGLQVESATHVQCFKVCKPCKSDVIIRPASRDRNRNLVFVIAIERPIIGGGQLLHDIHWMLGAFHFFFRCDQH